MGDDRKINIIYGVGFELLGDDVEAAKELFRGIPKALKEELDRVWKLTEDEARVFVADTARDGHDVMFCRPIGG